MNNAVSVTQVEQWLVSGEVGRAQDACLDLLAEHPSDPDLRTLLALTEELSGQIPEAIERLELVLNTHPEHVRTLFHLARLLFQSNDVNRSRSLLDQCIALSPNHAPSRALWARLEHKAGNLAGAIEGLRVALKADASYLPALCDLAVLLVEAGAIDEARGFATKAIEGDPTEGAAQLAMGVVMEAQGHLSFAEQCLVNATDQDPNSYQGLMALCRVYQRQGRHPEALKTLERLSDEQKNLPASRFARAFSLVRLGKLQLARTLYEELIQERADTKTVLQLMDLYIQLNDQQALINLSTSLDRTVQGADEAARFLDARLAEFKGEFDRAAELLGALLVSTNGDLMIRAHLVLARVGLKKGDTKVALDALKALAEVGALPHPVRWEIAQLAEQSGDRILALRMIDAVLCDEHLSSEVRGRTTTMKFHLLDRLERFEEGQALLQSEEGMGWLPVPGPLMSSALPAGNPQTLFPALPATDSGRPLIWVPGWPWAGRELVLAALAQIQGAQVLALADGLERHQHLGLAPGEPYFASIDADQAHQMRRRYLRGAREEASVWVEPFPCKAADLIRMRQVFPQSVAIRIVALPEYLALQWHLAGYRFVETMLEAWRAEQVALDHLAQYPEIRLVSVGLDSLLESQSCSTAIEALMGSLGFEAQPKMASHVQALIQRHGYRSPNHWKHYL